MEHSPVSDPGKECEPEIGSENNIVEKRENSAAEMWTNFLDDQDLSENLLSKAAVDLNEEDVVDRGVESYTVPEQKRKNYEKYVRNRPGPPIYDADEPFLDMPESASSMSSRKKNKNRKRKRSASVSYGKWKGLDLRQVAYRIINGLGETESKFLMNLIMEIGKEKAIELYDRTCHVEKSGGMMTADGSRRRTAGGVYMQLFKTDPDVLPVIKSRLNTERKSAMRKQLLAKRHREKAQKRTQVHASSRSDFISNNSPDHSAESEQTSLKALPSVQDFYKKEIKQDGFVANVEKK